jgi:hypothetical protein
MRTFIKIISVFSLLVGLSSCKTNPIGTSHRSDMTRNVEELQKREQAEKEKLDITSPINNYGKPASK